MMSRSILYMSMSLDGFVAGPGDDTGRGLGIGGERLHEWFGEWRGSPSAFQPPGASAAVYQELMATGAVVVGRRTFDYAGHWNGEHHDWSRSSCPRAVSRPLNPPPNGCTT
jgi:dihydrofolate reductase